jgi:hypothetical protein
MRGPTGTSERRIGNYDGKLYTRQPVTAPLAYTLQYLAGMISSTILICCGMVKSLCAILDVSTRRRGAMLPRAAETEVPESEVGLAMEAPNNGVEGSKSKLVWL